MCGRRDRLAGDLRADIARLEDLTKGKTGLRMIIAMDYGGRDEIVRAAVKMAEDARRDASGPGGVTEDVFARYLDTYGIPDPALIIRTSGELRLSNFLIWQAGYAEMAFPDILWPDFTINDLLRIVEEFNRRERRFGGRK